MTDLPYFEQEHTTRRGIVVMMLIGVAVIHLTNDIVATWDENRRMFWAALLIIAAALVIAELLTRYDRPSMWAAAGLLGAVAIAAFVLSRSVGLPGDHDADVGNWTEPLGLAALLVEAILVLMVAAHFTTLSRNRV